MRIAILVISILFALSCKTGIEYPEGGYDYVKNYKAEDTGFYFLPVRDSFSRRDSFGVAWDSEALFPKFNEPNLSLKPLGEDVFRFMWYASLGGLYFVTLKTDRIIVKKSLGLNPCYNDTNKLSETERKHFELLDRYFPIDEHDFFSERRKRYFDSLIKIYPELLDPKYYFLLKKKISCDTVRLKYSTKEIIITANQHKKLIDGFNNCGYWKLPVSPVIIHPENMCMDYPDYSLEANTAKKYNYVRSFGCLENPNVSFNKACQQLIKAAGLDTEFWVYKDKHTGTDTTTQVIVPDIPLEQPKEKKSKKKHL
jgi:hypothetical protein